MLVIALFSFTGYGISWDEHTQRRLGFYALGYLLNPGAYSELYLSYYDKDYSVFFELILAGAELLYAVTVSVFDFSGSSFDEWKTYIETKIYYAHEPEDNSGYYRQVILLRHFITHLFFLIAAVFAYKSVYFIYKNKTLAVIAFFLFVLHPRLYGHSFFNSKDIPFLSMFMVSLYYTAVALQHKTCKNFIILGVCAGILTNIRIMGVMLPCLVGCFLLLDMLKEKSYRFYAKRLAILAFVSCITLYASWPYLWNAPVENFIAAFNSMKNFRKLAYELFNGSIVVSTNAPASYIPIWFSFTTPVAYLGFGLLGMVLVVAGFFKQPMQFLYQYDKRFLLICCAVFLAPVMLVILFNSTLYGAWEKMYFIYAGFVFVAVYGIHFLIQKNRKTVYLPFIAFVFCGLYIIRAYPLQQTYFNELVPKKNEYISRNFAYHTPAVKDVLEYILKTDSAPVIKVSVVPSHTTDPLERNRQFLKPESERLLIIDRELTDEKRIAAADYIILYSDESVDFYVGVPVHKIKRQNNTIVTIYKPEKPEMTR